MQRSSQPAEMPLRIAGERPRFKCLSLGSGRFFQASPVSSNAGSCWMPSFGAVRRSPSPPMRTKDIRHRRRHHHYHHRCNCDLRCLSSPAVARFPFRLSRSTSPVAPNLPTYRRTPNTATHRTPPNTQHHATTNRWPHLFDDSDLHPSTFGVVTWWV